MLVLKKHVPCATGVSDVNIQNNSGYTAVMLASLTAPDGPGGMEVVRKLMEQGDINIRSSKVPQAIRTNVTGMRWGWRGISV